VELEAAGPLVGAEVGEALGLGDALDEGPRRDHLADVEAGAEAGAQAPEGPVRDAGHGREDDGDARLERADARRVEILRAREGQVGVARALVDGLQGGGGIAHSAARARRLRPVAVRKRRIEASTASTSPASIGW